MIIKMERHTVNVPICVLFSAIFFGSFYFFSVLSFPFFHSSQPHGGVNTKDILFALFLGGSCWGKKRKERRDFQNDNKRI